MGFPIALGDSSGKFAGGKVSFKAFQLYCVLKLCFLSGFFYDGLDERIN